MIIGIPLVLLGLGVIAATIIAGLIVFVSRRRQARSPGPVCGHCGYSVLGLTTMTCPECGGDLRTVGIRTPLTPPAKGLLRGIVYFNIVLAFLAIVSIAVVISVVPARHSYRWQVQLGKPHSLAYQSVTIRAARKTWRADSTRLPVEIELSPKPGATPATTQAPHMTEHPDGGYESIASGSRLIEGTIFGRQAVLDWMKASGIDTDKPDVQREAARIASEARAAARATRGPMNQPRYTGYSSNSSSGSDPAGLFNSLTTSENAQSEPPILVPIALLVFWLVVWIWGLVYVSARGRRRTAAERDANACASAAEG